MNTKWPFDLAGRGWIAAIVFLAIQYSGMNSLLETHFTKSDGSTKVYGICFVLAFLHALHVIGGMLFLGWVIFQGYRNRYDHERNSQWNIALPTGTSWTLSG